MTESEKTVQGMHENRNKIFFFLGDGARSWTRPSRVLTVPCIVNYISDPDMNTHGYTVLNSTRE